MTRIPRTEIDALPIQLGGNVFGWTADEHASHAILDAFVDGGGSLVDTADVYSAWVPGSTGGESERIIGSWIARTGRRDDLVIATKVGKLAGREGLAADTVAAAADESLERLGIGTIDLYYAHADDPSQEPAQIVAAFDALVRAGKIRHWALSNVSGARTTQIIEAAEREGLAAPVAIQPHWNLVHREAYEDELAPVVAEHDLAVLPYYGLASGFLTGKYTREDAREQASGTARGGAVARYFTDGGFAVVDELRAIADELATTPAAVALAWLVAQPGAVFPIASASTVHQVDALLASARLELDGGQLERLDSASRQPVA